MIKLKFLYTLLLIVLITNSSLSYAQEEVFIKLSKDTILIGDQIELKLSAKLNREFTDVTFPIIPDTFSKIEIIKRDSIQKIENKEYYLYEQKYLITSFDEGKYNLATWFISYKNPIGEEKKTSFTPVDLVVKTISVDTTQPIKPIFEIEEVDAPDLFTQVSEWIKENKNIAWGILIGLILLCLILFLIFRKKKKKKVSIPKELPFVKAKRLVQELENSTIWEKGDYKGYYSTLSGIIKDYFEEQLSIQANEMTTRDLLNFIKKSNNFRGIHQEMRQIMSIADMTKFAKGIPNDEDRIESVKNTLKIIEYTQPRIENSVEDKNNDQ